eukprot:6023217-Ditylum_brightwellii.AAC.1
MSTLLFYAQSAPLAINILFQLQDVFLQLLHRSSKSVCFLPAPLSKRKQQGKDNKLLTPPNPFPFHHHPYNS